MAKILNALICIVTAGLFNAVYTQTIRHCGGGGYVGRVYVTVRDESDSRKFFKILSQPLPDYPQKVFSQGRTSLKVTFLAGGKIGKIIILDNLPNGLTKNAVKAARQIKFVPERKNGKPATVSKIIVYDFRKLSRCL